MTEDGLKVATLPVHEVTEGEPIEIWVDRRGRVVVRARNECGNAYTDVDLFDLLEWARGNENLENIRIPPLPTPQPSQ